MTRSLTAILLFLLLPLQALAALYGTIQGPTSTLVELDQNTGAVIQTLGDIGYRVNGMSYDATTGTLYATTANGDTTFPDGLITINLTTGAGTPIGAGAGQLVNVPAANSAGDLYGWSEDSDDLVLWDKTAGTVTVVGDSALSSAEQSLAFDSTGTLYYVSVCCEGIQVIDTSTGTATPGSTITGNTGSTLHHGDFLPGTSLLYAITEVGGTNPRSIDILDVTTGNVIDTITAPDNLHTLAFTGSAPPAVAPRTVPTLSQWSLILTAALLALFGLIAHRRRFV